MNFQSKQKSEMPSNLNDIEHNDDLKDFQDLFSVSLNPERMSQFSVFCLQFKAMLLKRFYSFKRDWRMWLIMVLPSLIIALFLAVGFQNE